MSNNGTSRISHRTIVAVALACLVLAVMTMATLWQAAVHHSKANDAQTHASTAALFQSAETEGKTAGGLMQQQQYRQRTRQRKAAVNRDRYLPRHASDE